MASTGNYIGGGGNAQNDNRQGVPLSARPDRPAPWAANQGPGIQPPTVGAYLEDISHATSTVAYPAQVNAGDLLLLCGSVNNIATITAPGGWTTQVQVVSTGGTVQPVVYLATKFAAGTEGGTTLSVTHASSISSWQIFAVGGVDATNPLDVAIETVDQTTSTNNTTAAGSSLGVNGDMGLFIAAQNSTVNTSTPPANWLETADTTGTRSFTVAYRLGFPAGTSGSVGNTWSASARSVGLLAWLRPTQPAVAASGTGSLSLGGSCQAAYMVPGTVDDTDTTDMTSALNTWLATVPDNAVAMLNPSKTYRVEGTISLPSRTGLTFDLAGSTLHCHAAPTESQPMVKFSDGTGTRVRNGALTASYASPGTFTSAVEHAHAVSIVGTQSAWVDHLTMTNFAGDDIYWGLSESGSHVRSSGQAHNNTYAGTGRNAESYVACHDVNSHDHVASDIGLYAFDVEPNLAAFYSVDHVTVDTVTIHTVRSFTMAIIENNPVDSVTFSNIVTDDTNGFKLNISDSLGNPVVRPTNVTLTNLSCPTQFSNPFTFAIKHVDGMSITGCDIPLWCSSNPSYVCLVEDCSSVTTGTDTISSSGGSFPPGSFFLFKVTAAGSLSLSGGAVASEPATGSLTLSGSAVASTRGTAALSLAGSAVASEPGTGSLTLAGSATWSTAATGSLSLAGSGVASEPGTGSLTLSGSAAAGTKGTASLTLAGSAVGSSVASGSLTLSGSAVASTTTTGSLALAGSATWSTAATGSITLTGVWVTGTSGSGSLSLAGSSTSTANATTSGSLALSGSAVASTAATGALSLTGSAVASTQGTAALSLSGSAVASIAATGTLALSGSAAAGTKGTAALSLSGAAVASSTTTASLSLAASGSARGNATGAASITLTGVGPAFVTATASLNLAALATAGISVSGTALLTLLGTLVAPEALGTAQGAQRATSSALGARLPGPRADGAPRPTAKAGR